MTRTTNTAPTPVANKRQPVTTVDHFPLRAAIWDNMTRDGEVFYSVTFERAYKKDGKWNSSSNFNRADLLALAKLADAVETEIREMLDARRTQEAAAQAVPGDYSGNGSGGTSGTTSGGVA